MSLDIRLKCVLLGEFGDTFVHYEEFKDEDDEWSRIAVRTNFSDKIGSRTAVLYCVHISGVDCMKSDLEYGYFNYLMEDWEKEEK